jgi:hypothetical protein
MSRPKKTLEKVLRATSDANIAFEDLCGLLDYLDFEVRIKGSHHLFTKDGVEEILNLQPRRGGEAKPYQVKQVREVIQRYGLALRLIEDEEPPDAEDSDE